MVPKGACGCIYNGVGLYLGDHLMLFDYRVDVSVSVYPSDFQFRGKKLWISTLALFLSLWPDFNLQPLGKIRDCEIKSERRPGNEAHNPCNCAY